MTNQKNKILLLGNGADINDIDFTKIDDSFIIAGVNRIYKKYIPEYYFIYDLIEIMPEIPDNVTTIHTVKNKYHQYIEHDTSDKRNKTFVINDYSYYTQIFNIQDKVLQCNFSPVNFLIRLIDDILFMNDVNYFYIAGVPLLENVGHFYDESINKTEQKTLDKIYNDFLRLAYKNYHMISVMKESKLNNILPVIDKDILYYNEFKTFSLLDKTLIYEEAKKCK